MKHKFFLVLFLFAGMTISVFAQKVTLNLQNAKLEKVFSTIEKQTGLTFAYSSPFVNSAEIVSIKADNEDVGSVLSRLFTDKDIKHEISGGKIFLKPINATTSQQNASASGKITDAIGALIGASVKIKGTNRGTVTDLDGNFTLPNVAIGDVLEISYLGYDKQEIVYRGQTINVQLQEESQKIGEVVVVGYGTQNKRDVSTSIAMVKADDLQDIASTNIEQALTGRMAGVQITQPDATPGSGMNIKVRGVGTITAGSNPLYVVDGVPLDDNGEAAGMNISPIAMLDMNDIESIQVLKDASSAAIYGSRGANGVVLITTKNGKSGKPQIKFDSYVGVQSIANKVDVLDAYQYSQLVYEGHNAAYYEQLARSGKTSLYNPNATNQERWNNLRSGSVNLNQAWMLPPEILPYVRGEQGLTNTDWQDAVLRSGIIQKYYLSVAGGNENIRYLISGNYRDEEGIVLGSDYIKTGLRGKVDMNYKKFRSGINFTVDRGVYDLVNSSGRYSDNGILSAAIGAAPIYPVYNDDGDFNYEHFNTSYGNSKIPNPVAIATLIDDRMVAVRMMANIYAQYEFMKGLSFKTTYGVSYNNFARNYYSPASLPTSANRTPPANPVAISRTKNKYSWVWENTLTYKNTFGKHKIEALAGWTAQKDNIEGNYISATDLPQNDILHAIPNTATPTKYNSTVNEWSLLSALARVQYSYNRRYNLSLAFRADGSSRFGKNNRWGYFPSASAAWIVTEENFMKNINWLSSLKLRLSYGQTGNMSIGNYASFALVNSYNYPFGGGSSIGMAESSAGNPNIGWEKTTQTNLGFEAEFFKFLTLEFDIYKGTTSDMLFEVPVLEYSGFSSILQNIGKVENKGLEIVLSSNNKIGNVTWINRANFSMNRNKVKSLGGNSTEYMTTSNNVITFLTKVGEPIGNYFTYVTNGVYKNQAEIDADVANGIVVPNAKPGDFRFKKYGTNETIDADDRQITGNYLPDFTYGFSTQLKWKWFDFSLSLQGVYGNEIANINRRYIANMEGNANQLSVALDRWKSETDTGSGKVYRANRSATGMNAQISTWHIEDGSYMRIRDITVGYTFPKSLLAKAGITAARIYISAFNPFTFTKYSGYNPEVSNDSDPLHQGVDYGTYPVSRTFLIGVNLTF